MDFGSFVSRNVRRIIREDEVCKRMASGAWVKSDPYTGHPCSLGFMFIWPK